MHTRESKENLVNINGNRPGKLARLDRSLSRNKEDGEGNILSLNTASSLIEQAKPDELATGNQTERYRFSMELFSSLQD